MEAAAALGREQAIPALKSSLTEANAVVAAQQRASEELTRRAAQQRLLLHELSHRVKNILAVVQSLVARTVSDGRSLSEARDILIERLLALGRAHGVLMRTEWSGASLREIVQTETAPFSNRLTMDGPEITVKGAMIQTFALVLHELATNATKHGSLASKRGTLEVSWSIADGMKPSDSNSGGRRRAAHASSRPSERVSAQRCWKARSQLRVVCDRGSHS